MDTIQELDQWTSRVLNQRQSIRLNRPGLKPIARLLSIDDMKTQSKQTPQIPSIKAYCDGLFWAEYFNSMLKCWEPLVDPCLLNILHEQV